ncbi:aminopeptidase C [Marinifilum caeruleilacunae]|jgi:bleomycin hydrolase|uniref:Aminopeptidase n=1 Tax=Marinifilum caeruleilacunae TaxID=2499076 RepID=A0ABX1WSF6_9BACT|nr:C1 family peptidase [Marinifilum caeruleilacunae]NOU59034.1 aminopeptidase [Marinifilum caeruleilacunae]
MKLKFLSVGLLAAGLAFSATAGEKKEEKKEAYQFTDIKRLPATSVKDQHRSGTCWSFSGLSFIESEMMRMGKPEVDLSEMFVVYNCYSDKAKRHVRMHGNFNFGGGGAFHDVTYVLKNYGIVPEGVYEGLNYGEQGHTHGELDAVLNDYVTAVIKNRNKKLTPVWHVGFDGILDAYLGEKPEKFEYEGKEYTPKSFAKDFVGLNADDYIEISSYTHHPFYEKFIIEVPDNWLWDEVYNVPMNEMMEIMEKAIMDGYTIGWASDVSEKGFMYRKGIAIVPETETKNMSDSEISKWESLSKTEKAAKLSGDAGPVTEKKITQEMRQVAYDNYTTTDDHGMHIVGIAKDQKDNKYFIVKNSWADDSNKYNGYFYASYPFVAYKTMSFMIHKDALSKEMKNKLGL